MLLTVRYHVATGIVAIEESHGKPKYKRCLMHQ